MKTQAIVVSVLLGLIATSALAHPEQEARIAALEAKLAAVTNVTVNGQPTVRFTGVNVQIVNGTETTESRNGRGNLLLGYDLARNDGIFFCSNGFYPASKACTYGANGLWAVSHKSGSHYLVIGDENNYSQYGGLVVGWRNTSNRAYASVTGGYYNTASGEYASVSGGGGNTASGSYASVSGGSSGTASGFSASVSGGTSGTASGGSASVSGGSGNTANGDIASVSGGWRNTATGILSSVSGGSSRTTFNYYDWAAGGLYQGQ